ncbi:MAG: hypothetical protein ABSC01_06315 [Verrucomicrobiota bacterium]|jgi:hypothetical protein
MKKSILFGTLALLAGPLIAADSSPKDDVIGAAQKLAATASYSWNQTVVVPESAQFKPGPTDGKTEKGGATYVKMSFGDNTTEIVMKGDKAAVTDPDGDWQSITNLENDSEGPGRFLVGMVRNFRAPAAQATNLVASVKELKKDGDVYAGDLTEDGAKELLTFRRGGGATVSNPKGSVKFWVKDGQLSKYEYAVQGKVDFNGNEVDVDRDTTVVIKDVGATKVVVPDGAKKVL